MILRRRAEEMLRLMQLTEAELTQAKDRITGEVNIGAGESHAFHFLSSVAAQIAQEHPEVRFHVVSGDTRDLMEQLNNGLLDFALIFSEVDRSRQRTGGTECYHAGRSGRQAVDYFPCIRRDDPWSYGKAAAHCGNLQPNL